MAFPGTEWQRDRKAGTNVWDRRAGKFVAGKNGAGLTTVHTLDLTRTGGSLAAMARELFLQLPTLYAFAVLRECGPFLPSSNRENLIYNRNICNHTVFIEDRCQLFK